MASGKDRARKLARAKVERQQARRAASERQSRRIKASVGAGLAVLLVVLGGVWLFGGFDSDDSEPAADSSPCVWTSRVGEPDRDDVGKPPETGLPTEGTRPMTITINSKPIVAEIDLGLAPCAGASLAHLASQSYFDNSTCHELNLTEGYLRCGDKKGTGLGGPGYSFANEYVPNAPASVPSPTVTPSPAAEPVYPRGTITMIGSPPGSNGSQFLIYFKDASPAQPDYSIVGTVNAEGLTVVDEVVKAGTVDNGSGQNIKPKNDVIIQSLTVGEVSSTEPTTAPTPSSTAAATASPSAS